HGLGFADLPPGTIASAKEQLASILGATYGGSVMGPGIKAAQAVRSWRESGPSTVIGKTRFRTSMRNAAMTNSYLAQILEWEDWTFLAHSGASIVPVALAAGEQAAASGRDVLTAIVAANEILARAGGVLTDAVNTGNALAVHQIETTLVAGKLLGLSAEQLQDALGIACTQPQMTSIISWTAEAKGMLTGWPAATAVSAAHFAQAGMSGNRTILVNPLGYHVLGRQGGGAGALRSRRRPDSAGLDLHRAPLRRGVAGRGRAGGRRARLPPVSGRQAHRPGHPGARGQGGRDPRSDAGGLWRDGARGAGGRLGPRAAGRVHRELRRAREARRRRVRGQVA